MRTTNSKRLRRQILTSLLVAGTIGLAGMAGTAQAAIVTDQYDTTKPIAIDNTTEATTFYGNKLLTENLTITELKDNTLHPTTGQWTALGGGLYGEGFFSAEQLAPVSQKITFDNATISGNKVIADYDYARAGGGAMFLKGTDATFKDVSITDNTAEGRFAYGGAVYTDYKGNTAIVDGKKYPYTIPTTVTFIATKDGAYTGNDVKAIDGNYQRVDDIGNAHIATTSGGFLAMDPNTSATFDVENDATLTIGKTTPATSNEDTISSFVPMVGFTASLATPYMTKTGTGTLTINSNLNKYHGLFTIDGGTVNLVPDLLIDNTYTVQQGTLNMGNVTVSDLDAKYTVGDIPHTNNGDGTLTVTSDEGNPRSVPNGIGSLVTAAGTTTTAQNVTVNHGASLNAQGLLTISGNLEADAATVTAANATIGGTVSAANKAAVSLGGSNLSLSKINVDNTSGVTLTGGTLAY